jgi:hypothetical protein
LASAGSFIYGLGFLLAPDEREALIRENRKNAERIFPFPGGDEVNTSPRQAFDRYVISFHGMSLDEAAQWPDLLDIIRERVKPERDRLRDDNASARVLKTQWWRFQAHRPKLYEALNQIERCLVTSAVTKHLAFSFQASNQVFAHSLQVIVLPEQSAFACLQSRVHEAWARLLSSSMRTDLRYSASDCFETFPFPQSDPRTVIPALEDIGQRLYDLRAKYMVDENVGLTVTYNRLKDPACTDARILELRRLHEEMDRAVLAAYAEGDPEGRWLELEVPPYCPMGDAEKAKLQGFEDALIDRLFALNAKRAAAERGVAMGGGEGKTKAPKAKRAKKSEKQLEIGEPKGD